MASQGVREQLRALGKAITASAVAGWLGALLLLAVTSCGKRYFFTGAGATPTPTTTGGVTPTPQATAGLVFATNNADGMLSEFSRDLTSGVLTLLGTTAAGAASGPTGLALAPSNSFLYVANAGDATVREFSVNTATGALTAIGSVSDGANSAPQAIAIDPTGSYLYVTNAGAGGSISEYKIAANGTLSANGKLSGVGLSQPMGIASAPGAGGAVYVADFTSGTVMSFRIQGGGALTPVSSVPSLGPSGTGQPRGIAVDPSGNFVYAVDAAAAGVVSVFSVGVGNSLAFAASYPTAPFTNQPFDLALANNLAGLFLYTTNQVINTISEFVVFAGVLSLQTAASGLTTPAGIAASPDGNFVYEADSGSGQIVGYVVGAGGTLSPIGAFATENPPNSASQPQFIAITQ
jgi:DNA-binding beta-propeller fold protein YncE